MSELGSLTQEYLSGLLPRRQAQAARAAVEVLVQMDGRDPRSLTREELALVQQATAISRAVGVIGELSQVGGLPSNKRRAGVVFDLECRWQEGSLLHQRGTPSPEVEEEMVEKLKVLRYIINRIVNGGPIRPRFCPVWLWRVIS